MGFNCYERGEGVRGSRVLRYDPAPSGREPGVIVLKGLVDVRGNTRREGKACVCVSMGVLGREVAGWLAGKET